VVSHLEPGLELAELEFVALYLVKPVQFDVIEAAMDHLVTSPMCDVVGPRVRDSRA
jgi:hypothetical protein